MKIMDITNEVSRYYRKGVILIFLTPQSINNRGYNYMLMSMLYTIWCITCNKYPRLPRPYVGTTIKTWNRDKVKSSILHRTLSD